MVAGLSVLIAILTALSGWVFSGAPEPRHTQAATPVHETRDTSSAVLSKWLWIGESTLSLPLTLSQAVERPVQAGRVTEAVVETLLPFTVAVDVVPAVAAEAAKGGTVHPERGLAVAPALTTGDRPMVTLSFYYCEEAKGNYLRGDGGGFCGVMRDGSVVRDGAAACDDDYLGQRFRIEGDPLKRTYFCADTGSAVHGLHRDIWFLDNGEGWRWQRQVGKTAVIEIVP